MNKRLTSITLSSLLLLAACGDDKKQEVSIATVPESSTASAHTNVMTPSAAVLSRLTLAQVSAIDWFSILTVSGSIELDEKKIARVGTTVSGRVTEIHRLRGDRVQQGDVLAMIHSPGLAEAQVNYLQAQVTHQLAQKAAQRAQLLLNEGVIASVEQQRRHSEYLSSELQWQAAYDRMRILGMQDDEIRQLEKTRKINSLVALRSPMDGVVIDRNLSQGQVLEPADWAYTIADLSQVWVVGEVPERYATEVKLGKQIEVHIPALANEVRSAQLSYVAHTVNPQTRTLRVRAVLDNTDERLKPDMLANLSLLGTTQQRLAIPESAVVRDENQDKVFVRQDDQQFTLTTVQLGDEERGFRPVIYGLSLGQTIVVDGVFYLNAERLMNQQRE